MLYIPFDIYHAQYISVLNIFLPHQRKWAPACCILQIMHISKMLSYHSDVLNVRIKIPVAALLRIGKSNFAETT